jgi:hypothetical protein
VADRRPPRDGRSPRDGDNHSEDLDLLPATLARLSAALDIGSPPADLAATLDVRIRALPAPAPRSGLGRGAIQLADRLRRHWRAATAVAVALLLGLLAVSPAGARIAQWLGLGAVQVVQDGAPATGAPDPASTDGFTEVTLDVAGDRVAFPLAVPAALGPPTRVLLNPDATVVSMVWDNGDPAAPGPPIRLDQVAGRPDYVVVKKYANDIEFTRVNGADAFWLRVPHPLSYTDAVGVGHTEPSRIAGPTLIWQDGTVTLRLEGVDDEQRALQIARSMG